MARRSLWSRATLVATIAIAAGAAAFAPVAPPRAVEGYVVTQRITTNGSKDTGTVRLKLLPGRVRIEMEGVQAEIPAGVFMLMRDDGRLSVVMPSERRVMVMDIAALTSGAEAMGGMGSMEFKDVSADVEDLGAGETILGYATRKYRITQKYTIAVSIMGQSMSTTNSTAAEVWMAADVPGVSEGMNRFTESVGGALSGGAGPAKPLVDALKGKAPKGTALKSVATTTVLKPGEEPETTVTTSVVTSITKTDINAAEFETPAGYEVMDLAELMKKMRGMIDTLPPRS